VDHREAGEAMISEEDKQRVSDAIRRAELNTSGEIFCVITGQSSDYRFVPIAWAAALSLVTPMPLIYFTLWSVTVIYCAQLLVFVGAAIVLSIPSIRIRIIPRRTKHDRAHTEAMRQFLAHGIHMTEQRTGVLIFASAAERYAEIVADDGINAKVAPQVWDEAIAVLIDGIKAGHPADGFIAAIGQCGRVLAEHFPPGALNRDEVPDRLVIL
jgi:putative membrane protein